MRDDTKLARFATHDGTKLHESVVVRICDVKTGSAVPSKVRALYMLAGIQAPSNDADLLDAVKGHVYLLNAAFATAVAPTNAPQQKVPKAPKKRT